MTEKEWEEGEPCTPPPEVMKKLDRIGSILTTLCAPLGGDNLDLMVRNLDPECKAFLVCTPWGAFAVYDNGHDDHWSGGRVVEDNDIRRIPGCHQLHDILRLQLMVAIDATLIRMTDYLDDMPPPEKLN